MLIHDYSYYLYQLMSGAFAEPLGILALMLFGSAILILWLFRKTNWRSRAFWLLLLISVVTYGLSFRNTIYEYDERPETLVIDSLPPGEPDCGTAWTGFIRSGQGYGNPCPQGCFRGKVLRKQLRMRGIPPWPEYKREMQCWKRTDKPPLHMGFID
jgi:hypothetical protein